MRKRRSLFGESCWHESCLARFARFLPFRRPSIFFDGKDGSTLVSLWCAQHDWPLDILAHEAEGRRSRRARYW